VVTPVSSPRVSDDVVVFATLGSIAYGIDGVIEVPAAHVGVNDARSV